MGASHLRILSGISLLLVIFSSVARVRGAEPSIQTSRYEFLPDQSTIAQSGGFAGVHWTYAIGGQFSLIVDAEAGSARFEQVDANAIDESEPPRTLDPNDAFNLAGLTGTVVDDTTIEFTGQAADNSNVLLTLTFEDNTAHLTGETISPPNSADFFVFQLDATAQRKYAGGTGDPNTPYLIATAEHMNAIGTDPNDWEKHFQLTADIDLGDFEGEEFNVVGISYEDSFRGVFDGDDHTISNFACKSEGGYSAGLFGRVQGGIIKNLHLITANIDARAVPNVGSLVGMSFGGTISDCSVQGGAVTGGETVGGLVGDNGGTIINCYASCRVDGNSVGGLAGQNILGVISMCYSTGTVFGDKTAGGLVGQNGQWALGHGERISLEGRIDHSYSTCGVAGNAVVGGLVGFNDAGIVEECYSSGRVSEGEDVGGLVGYGSDRAEVVNCFWDVETGGLASSSGGTGKTTAQMQDPNTFREVDWDFVGQADGPHNIWAEPEGSGYPILSWQLPAGFGLPTFAGGSGGRDDPYLIATAEQLNSIGHNPRLMAASFMLLNDVDLADTAYFPIGIYHSPFMGVLDGNSYTVSNLKYASPEGDYAGLLGYVGDSDGKVLPLIKDLGLTGPNIDAGTGDLVGALIGCLAEGTVTRCYVEAGHVSGRNRVGGLIGFTRGTVTNCSSTGSVTGEAYVGGLVGDNEGGTVANGFGAGTVKGDRKVGGLAGNNSGNIIHCHSSGIVRGDPDHAGGLAGSNCRPYYYNADSAGVCITNCYSTTRVDGSSAVGGLVGYNEQSVAQCYSAGSISGEAYVGGLVGRNSYPGDVANCYATGQAAGQRYVGGLIGENQCIATFMGEIRNCYSTAGVISSSPYAGGLIGKSCGDAHFSFWDVRTSGKTSSAAGTGLTTAEMQTAVTFLDAGWDFVDETENGADNIWWILEGQDYPRLWWEAIEEF